MATIAKSGTPSLASVTNQVNSLAGLLAGEEIAAGDACYIKNDGRIWRASGAAANPAAKVFGYAAKAASAGEAITLVWNVRLRYGAGLTPGQQVFLGTGAGSLDTAATTGGTEPIGFVVDATRIHLWQARY